MSVAKKRFFQLVAASFLFGPAPAFAEDANSIFSASALSQIRWADWNWDKGNLWHPTPDDKLRSFATDRPTKSDTPFTVDAGHFQYETDLINYTYTHYAGAKTAVYQAADPVWKLGVTSNVDVEIQFNGYQNGKITDAATGVPTRQGAGFGDVFFRTKINLAGNDGGPLGFALFPFLKAPSGTAVVSNGAVEGGLILPLRLNVTSDYALIVMPEIDAFKNALSSQRHANFANLVNFNGPVPGIKDLSAYIEFYSAAGTDKYTPTIYTFDMALSYNITPTVQVDIGANIGLNDAAPKLQIYTGVAQRF